MASGRAVVGAARHNEVVRAAGRIGVVCYGLVHVLVAWLAAQVAAGDSGQRADQRGAVTELAASPVGPVLLWLLAAGLVLFGLWQLLVAAVGYQWVRPERKRLARRVGSAARGVVGLAIAGYAVAVVTGSGSKSGSGSGEHALTARLLAAPAGRLLVGAVAVAVLVVAVVTARKGLTRSYRDDLDVAALPSGLRRALDPVAIAAWCGKALAYAVVGVLFGIAAVRSDPNRSGGLDQALHTLAGTAWGTVLLVLIALGFLAFGGYCFLSARAQRG